MKEEMLALVREGRYIEAALMGLPAIPVLTECLEHENSNMREGAIHALEWLVERHPYRDWSETANALARAMKKFDGPAMSFGTGVLGKMGIWAAPALAKVFTECYFGSTEAGRPLFRTGLHAVPPLMECLAAGKKREKVLHLLVEIVKEHPGYDWNRHVPLLLECLRDEEGWVRKRASEVLAEIALHKELDMEAVKAAFKVYVDSVKKTRSGEVSSAKKEAATFYGTICEGVRKRLEKKNAGMDGITLEGTVKPPRKNKMYREGKRKTPA